MVRDWLEQPRQLKCPEEPEPSHKTAYPRNLVHPQKFLGATERGEILQIRGVAAEMQEWLLELVLVSRLVLRQEAVERLVSLGLVAAGRCGIRFWSTFL